MRKTSWVVLLLIFLSTSVLSAQEVTGTYDDVARRVEKEILEENKVRIENLKVLHNNGTIFLQGITNTFGSSYVAEKEAREVKGVEKVVNGIEIRTKDVPDEEIEVEAIRKIRSHLKGSPFDFISIKVNSGVVTLTGNVRDQTLVRDAMDSVMWLPGVRLVENKIEYATIGAGDERLRRALHRRLYREFPRYFVGKDPSVFIIVKGGRVLLLGQIESNVSREKIGSIVRTFPGVLSVENELRVN